jgi:hypothetical protein
MSKYKSSASLEAPNYLDWAPRLLRFFQLLIGDQAAAERLTIETLVEGAALGSVRLSIGMPVALVRCALKKAAAAPEQSVPIEDKLVRAVSSLPHSQRVVLVLFRGLGSRWKRSQTLPRSAHDASVLMVFSQFIVPCIRSTRSAIRLPGSIPESSSERSQSSPTAVSRLCCCV